MNLQFDERLFPNNVVVEIEKKKKRKPWEIINEPSIDKRFNEISRYDVDYFYTEFEELLYSHPTFTSIKKGRYKVQFEVTDRRITYTMNNKAFGEEGLNYSFGFSPPIRVRKPNKTLLIVGGVVGGVAIVLLNTYSSQLEN